MAYKPHTNESLFITETSWVWLLPSLSVFLLAFWSSHFPSESPSSSAYCILRLLWPVSPHCSKLLQISSKGLLSHMAGCSHTTNFISPVLTASGVQLSHVWVQYSHSQSKAGKIEFSSVLQEIQCRTGLLQGRNIMGDGHGRVTRVQSRAADTPGLMVTMQRQSNTSRVKFFTSASESWLGNYKICMKLYIWKGLQSHFKEELEGKPISTCYQDL